MHRLVASLWVVVCCLKGFVALAVGGPHALMRLAEGSHLVQCGAWGQFGQQLAGVLRHDALLFLKGGPVALALGAVLAAQQHVFPLLHLHLEVLQHGGGFALLRVALRHGGFVHRKRLVQLLYAEQGRTHQQQQRRQKGEGELETELHGNLQTKCRPVLRICSRPSLTSPRMTQEQMPRFVGAPHCATRASALCTGYELFV